MRLSFLRRRTWKKHLAMAVTVGLLAGAYAPGAMAADYSNKQIKGVLASDQKTFGADAVTQAEDGTLIYDLGEAMNFVNTSNAATVTNNVPSSLLVKNDVNIIVKGGDFGVNGISAGYSNPSFNKDGTKRAAITFDGNVTMRDNAVEGGWAITGSTIHGGYATYAGARWQPNAVRAGLLGDITFNGALDIAVKGSGLVTDPYYIAQNVDQYGTATINVNGDVTIDTPHEYTEAYYAIANYGGTINVNTDGTEVGDSKVVLNGNIITMNDTEGEALNPYFYRSGRTNIALTNKDSVWNGVIDNTSAAQTGEVNLWLQNGATWNHQAMSLTGGITLGVVPTPSNEHYGQYDGISYVNNFTGGKSAETSGYLYQKDSAAINIANYSGYTTVYYEHINSGVNASDYAAGDITIQKAAADSGITLVTANNNVKDDQINLVLNALAGKLTYVDYSNNPDNLDATVKIASGLTADSITVKSGNIVFDSTGKGGYTNKVSEFKTTLTGDAETDAEYKVAGVLLEDGTYKFTDDGKITVDGAAAIQADKAIVVDATGKALDLKVTNGLFGIAHSVAQDASITADKLNVDVAGSDVKAISAQNTSSEGRANVTINADTDIVAHSTGKAFGIFANENADITINGNTNITIDAPNANTGWYLDSAAIRAYSANYNNPDAYSTININGDLSIKTDILALYANGAGSTINLNGGVDITTTKNGQPVVLAEGGSVNINMSDNAEQNVVKIVGNVVSSASLANDPNKSAASDIKMQLLNKESAWQGVAYNSFPADGIDNGGHYTGSIELALANGATWNNQLVGAMYGVWNDYKVDYEGSHVTTFKGGASAEVAGNIYQKDANALTIDNYSGVTNVFYANDGATSGDFSAYGDTIIKHAETGSAINLITTAPTSVTADSITSVLSALAGKLTYAAYAENERNLTGTAKLAGGLTSDSVVMALGNIVFDENTGKGTGVNSIEATGPDHQVTTEFANTLTGDVNSDLAYVLGGVRQADGTYKFTDDSKITVDGAAAIQADKAIVVDAAGKALTLQVTNNEFGIAQSNTNPVNITADELAVSITGSAVKGIASSNSSDTLAVTTINAATTVNASGSNTAYGVFANSNAEINLNGDTKITIDAPNASASWAAAGIRGNSYGQYAAVVNVNGDLSVKGNAVGLYVSGAGSTISTTGNVDISATADNMAALLAENGTININVKEDANNVVKIDGNAVASANFANYTNKVVPTEINMNLLNADSAWHGVAYNSFAAEGITTDMGTYTGAINLSLANGATWTNEKAGELENLYEAAALDFAGSHVTTFKGGASAEVAGNIYQKDANALTIDNYSGVTNIFYAHEGDGTEAANYTAGDTIIKHAAENSAINLITTAPTNVTADSITSVLSALAGKLTYAAYAENERNLTGTAKIAGGLTSDSVVMALGNIVFDENTGKGTGVSSIEATGPDHQVTTEFANTLTGDVNSDLAYVLGGVRQADGTYKFTDDSKITVVASGAKAIDLNKSTVIDAGNNELSLNVMKADNYADVKAINVSAPGDYKILADKIVINSNASDNTRVEGISASTYDASSKINLSIDSDIDIKTNNQRYYNLGIYAMGNTKLDVKGNVNVEIVSTSTNYYETTGIYAGGSLNWNNKDNNRGSEITIDGDVNVSGNGNGVLASYAGSVANLNGNTTIVATDDGKMSVAAQSGTVNVNIKDSAVGDKTVKLTGNVGLIGGAVNPSETVKETVINIGLGNKESFLTGIVYDGFTDDNKAQGYTADANIWLQNGAVWNNTLVSAVVSDNYGTYPEFSGSHINKLTGGASAEVAGNIYQKDANALTIDNYSGVTNVFYANDGDFSAYGDTIIKHAETGSAINLITTSNGALTSDSISGILTALAGKLTYAAYADNERNLTGTAKIAAGLTSDSVVMALSGIVFDENTGKGSGISGIEIADAPEHQVATTINSTLTGDADKDLEYTLAGVLQKDGTYKFTEDSKIAVTGENARTISLESGATIDATGKALTLDIAESTTSAHGIFHDAAEAVNVKADTLNINIKSTDNGTDGAQGIRNLQGDVVLDADVNIDVNGTYNTIGIYSKNGNFDVNGDLNVKVEGNNGGYAQYGASGIYATSSMGSSKGGVLNVNGTYTFEGNANGIYANSGGSVVNVEGGSIKVAAGQSKGYAALIAEDATINLNVANGEATNNKVDVEGNVVLSIGATNENDIHGEKSIINLGLTTADSSLHGAVYNAFPEEGITKGNITFTGEANLWLQNGATWTNEVVDELTYVWGGASYEGSHVTTFKGGASAEAAGNIYQKDSNALTIDNYSGVTNIFYAHEGDGTEAADYTAGDTIIKHAEAGSVVNLITNGDGSSAADINVVANILSTLAGKLTYANYVEGERNLTGTVKLAAGLTTDSVTWAVKDIVFDEKSGQGGINKDAPIEFPEAPDKQESTDFNSGLNGSTNLEYVYGGVIQEDGSYKFTENTSVNVNQGAAVTADNEVKIDAQGQTLTLNVQPTDDGTAFGIKQTQAKDVNITAGTLEIKVLGGNGNEGIRIDNIDTDNTAKTNVEGNTNITLQGSASSKGITVNGNSQLNLKGDVTIHNNSSSSGEAAGSLAVGIYAGGNTSGVGAVVNVDGATSLNGAGTGVAVIGSASEVNLNGAVNINTSFDNMVAVVASSGTANINMNSDGPSNNTVKLNGNLMVTRDADKMGDTGYKSVINVNMDNASSSWTGVAYNQFDEAAAPVSLFALRRAAVSTGEINLSLSNGAVWNNEALGIVPDEAATFTGSHITNLNGGTSYSNSGYIYQKDTNPLTIDNYSGSSILVYDHGDNDGTDVAHYAAGNTIINSAAEGSLITLSTDSKNINVNDKDNVDAVMTALSQKLAYAAAGSDNNLQGQVQISGGLTSDKIALWLGDLTFDAANGGLGQFTAGSSHRNYTTAESEFVQGTRTAIMSNMLSWRDVAASSYNLRNMRRGQEAKGGAGPVDMGSRLAGADEGTWARVYGGQTKYSGNNTSFDGDYWAAQVGYDKQLANGWTMGVAIDYQDGSDSYKTGSGDTKLYGLGFYGSKEVADNSYLDLTARLGHVKNEFSASNETGKIDGDYSANGFSLSAQYSKRFGDDVKGYFEPQAQLTWARMGSSDFTAHGSMGSLHVNQDAMNSFVGRIGLEAGQASEHGNYFARISLAHEFAGDVDTHFLDSYGGTKHTSYDLGGTWSELTVGGTFNLNKSLHVYGDVTKGLSGDYKQDWKVNAGLRFTF